MPARPLPNLLLEAFFALGEDGWNDEFDRNMLKLSVLVQSGVSGKFAAEPGAPAAGTIIVLDEDHATHPNAIGVFDDGEWVYFLPNKGWLTYDQTEDVYLTFDGTAWAVLETGGGGGGGIPEAPADGKLYGRKDEAWAEVGSVGGLYRFGGFFTVTPAADETLMMHVATDGFTIPANLAGTVVDVGVNPDANTILSLYRNGVGIGSITVSAAGAITLAGTGATVVAGDLLTLEAPADSNGLADVAFTFRGEGVASGGGGGSVADLGAWSTNLPLAADLGVKVNGTATANLIESTQGVHVDFTVVGNYRGVFLGKVCPAAPFVAVMRVAGHFGSASEAGIGVALKDSATDKLIIVSRNAGDGNTYVQRWNSPNTYGGNLNNLPGGGVGGGNSQFEPIWLAIGVAADGAVTAFSSNNGVTWFPRSQENVSAFLGAAGAVGLHAFCNNTDGTRMFPALHYFDIIEGVAVPPNLFPRV